MNARLPLLALALVAVAACSSRPEFAGAAVERGVPVLAVDGFRVVDEGVAVAAQPSDAALRDAAAGGYRTVVNLRTDGEPGDPAAEGRLAQSLGLTYVRIPVARGDLRAEQADRLAEALAAEGGRPALVHCASGQRAVAVWALFLARHRGLTADEALAAADAAGIGADMRAALAARLHER